jgi:hypothetical protein
MRLLADPVAKKPRIDAAHHDGRENTMDELFPFAAGLLLGVFFATGFQWLRLQWMRIVLILAAGVSATVLSGEYRENWAFVLVDVGEVALLAWIGFVAARCLRSHFGAGFIRCSVR